MEKDKIILALDVNDPDYAVELVEQFGDYVATFKVGLELFAIAGQKVIENIHKKGKKVFLDLKFHDIPSTVAKASAVVTRLGVYMFNIHASGGYEMMRMCRDTVVNVCIKENLAKPNIIAVTVLTSISDEEFRMEMGYQHSIRTQVKHLAALSKRAGLDGVVASGHEIQVIRNYSGKDFIIVAPGIRPSWSPPDDQQRTMTPKEAIRKGADFLVIGRAILNQDDPVKAAKLISQEIISA